MTTKAQLLAELEKARAAGILMRVRLIEIRGHAHGCVKNKTSINNLWLIQAITETLTREEERRK